MALVFSAAAGAGLVILFGRGGSFRRVLLGQMYAVLGHEDWEMVEILEHVSCNVRI